MHHEQPREAVAVVDADHTAGVDQGPQKDSGKGVAHGWVRGVSSEKCGVVRDLGKPFGQHRGSRHEIIGDQLPGCRHLCSCAGS